MAGISETPQHCWPVLAAWLPLLQESLAKQGHFRWRLQGVSMLPTLPSDCEIDIVPAPDVVPLGALIVFASGSTLVTHRLVYRTREFLVTQGDSRGEPDPWLRPEQVVGVVSAAYRDGRHIWPGKRERLMRWRWLGRAYLLRLTRPVRRQAAH